MRITVAVYLNHFMAVCVRFWTAEAALWGTNESHSTYTHSCFRLVILHFTNFPPIYCEENYIHEPDGHEQVLPISMAVCIYDHQKITNVM